MSKRRASPKLAGPPSACALDRILTRRSRALPKLLISIPHSAIRTWPMSNPKILIQLDSDPHPSVFDAVVATDAGVDRLLQYGGVEPSDVRDLVHGAIFTRSPQDLPNTAIFIGGSNVKTGEELL